MANDGMGTTPPDSSRAPTGTVETPGYDASRRRRATRAGRQTGCYVYIPGDELAAAGFVPGGPLPWYRVWGSKRGVVLRLYRDAPQERNAR